MVEPSSCMSKSENRTTDNSLGSRSTPDTRPRACKNRKPADPAGNLLSGQPTVLGTFCGFDVDTLAEFVTGLTVDVWKDLVDERRVVAVLGGEV